MSWTRSPKGQSEAKMGQHKDSRGSHSLLRLDSTGEITSDSRISQNRSKFMCRRRYCTSTNTDVNGNKEPYLKKLVENLNVCSIFDSANMCIESAASYLESFTPRQSTKNSLVSENINRDSLGFFKSIFSSERPKMATAVMNNTSCALMSQEDSSGSARESMNFPATGTNCTWSCSNLLGALQSRNLISSSGTRSTCKSNISGLKTDIYVPPQRRKMTAHTKPCISVDPKLTPYNAKLLAKSRQSQNHCHSEEKDSVQNKKCEKILTESNTTNRSPRNKAGKFDHNANGEKTVIHSNSVCEVQSVSKEPVVQTDDVESKPDWFEYECKESKVIPITISEEKLEASLSMKEGKNQIEPREKEMKPSKNLRNWYSVELDSDVHKNSNLNHKLPCQFDNSKTYVLKDNKKTGTCMQEKKQNACELKGSVEKKEETKVKPQSHCEKLGLDGISAVLFLRQCGKKSRPSKKKRIRQKAQLEQGSQSATLKPGSSIHPRSPVAFILGVNSKSSESGHSFHFTCDIDSDEFDDSGSDFSCESDDDFSSLDDDLLGLRCNDPLSSFGIYTVSCSVQSVPQTIPSTSPPCSTKLDAVNERWRRNMSQISDHVHKSSKKVD